MVKWENGKKKRLTQKVKFKYNFKWTTDYKYFLTFYLDVPAIFLTKIFESIITDKDPQIDLETPEEFLVPKETYDKILKNKRLHKWVKQVETQMKKDLGSKLKFVNTQVRDNGMRYKKEGDLYKVTIDLEGDYTYL